MNSHSNQYLPRGWKTLKYGSYAVGIYKTAVHQSFFFPNAVINITAVGSPTKQRRLWKQDFRVICHVQATVKKRTVLKAALVKRQQPTSAFYTCTFCLQGKCIQIHRETNGFANTMHLVVRYWWSKGRVTEMASAGCLGSAARRALLSFLTL